MFLFLIISVIIVVVVWKRFLRLDYWEKKGISYESGLPILGTGWKAICQREHMKECLQRIYDKYYDKQCVGFFFFTKPSLIVKDLELIKAITVKDFDHFVDHNTLLINDDLDVLMAKNLFSLKGQRWHEMRSTLSPAFTGSKMKFMFQLISDCGKQMQNFLKEELQKNQNSEISNVELKDVMSRYTVDVIATSAFGIKVDSFQDKNNEFMQNGRKASQFQVWRLVFIVIAPWIMKIFKTGLFPQSVNTFVQNIIHNNIATRERDGIVRPDLIHILMQARKGTLDNDNEENDLDKLYGMNTAILKTNKKIELTELDIAAQGFVFFLAGFENTAASICFIAYELALNPDVQKRLQDEIDQVTERNGGQFTYHSMQELKYMDMVIAETHRMWTLLPIMDRVCTKPYTLKTNDGDIYLAKGDIIHIPILSIHYDPKYFPNPKKFDPERFSDENKSSFERSAYMPFGVGPRICIGQRFALMETKIAIYHLLKNFDLVVTEKTQIPIKMSNRNVLLLPEKGFDLGLKLRQPSKTK